MSEYTDKYNALCCKLDAAHEKIKALRAQIAEMALCKDYENIPNPILRFCQNGAFVAPFAVKCLERLVADAVANGEPAAKVNGYRANLARARMFNEAVKWVSNKLREDAKGGAK